MPNRPKFAVDYCSEMSSKVLPVPKFNGGGATVTQELVEERILHEQNSVLRVSGYISWRTADLAFFKKLFQMISGQKRPSRKELADHKRGGLALNKQPKEYIQAIVTQQ